MEQDLKILETIVNYRKFDGIYSTNEVIFKAIEHLIKAYKELEEKWDKDTHKLQNDLEMANADKINNYIPVSLVEETIKELNKQEKQELKGLKGQDRYFIKQMYQYKRRVLQDLLEKRK